MNGADCHDCGQIPCRCEDVKADRKRDKELNPANAVIEKLFKTFNKPGRMRRWMLKRLYPELTE